MDLVLIGQLLESQREIKGAISKLLSNFKKEGLDRRTPDLIKRRLVTLYHYWSEFETNHSNLLQKVDGNHEYITSDLYEETKALFEQTVETLEAAQPKMKQQPPPSVPQASVSGTNKGPISIEQKPEENIPKFTHQGSPSKLDDLLKKQTSNFKALQRTIRAIDLDAIEEKWELEDVLKAINARWKAIDSLHWEIDGETDGDNLVYEELFTTMEKSYNFKKRSINSKLWNVAHREKSTPQIDMPTFSGSYQQWTSFKDLFTETIHTNPALSYAQKMQFLKSKIKGEAERLIQHLPISSENYTVCWEILSHRYNNKKLIFTSHVNNLLNVPSMQHPTTDLIKKLHDTTTECINAIKNLQVDVSTWDPLLVHLLSQKLDAETHEDYLASLKQPRELPSLREFLDFLEAKFTTMESARRKQEGTGNFQKPVQSSSPIDYVKKSNSSAPKHAKTKKGSCPVCKEDHGIYFCNKFLAMTPIQKRRIISSLKLCNNCLHSHQGECRTLKKCRECNESHNSLLHDAFLVPSSHVVSRRNEVATEQANSDPTVNNTSHVTQQRDIPEVLLATALIKVLGADGNHHTMRCLIDQGSQTCLISNRAAQNLALPRKQCKGVITGVGTKDSNCKGLININCTSLRGCYTFNTDVIVMNSLTNNLPGYTFTKPTWEFLENISLADPEFYISRPIDILLGANIYADIILEGICKTDKSLPIAQQTKLGWILCGNVRTFQCNIVLSNIQEIQKFWEIEDVSETAKFSSEESECIEFYKNTTRRMPDGKYEVRLPLKCNIQENLGQSKHIATAQLLQLERKLMKHNEIADQYKSFIEQYLFLRHMKIVTGNKTPECYLPHHCVLRQSSTTALRVVFNASAHTSNGTSLNDCMHKGPNLQVDLQALILSFRKFPIAFTADIEKMFRQIWVHEEDQHLQKILWRSSTSEKIQEFSLSTVTYGFKAAPFLAMMTLKQLANDERQNFPEAAQVLESCMYMDDLLHGSYTLEEAKQLRNDLIKLMQSGGFNLRKWSSNIQELADDQGEDNFNFKQLESTKTLGLHWNPIQDTFQFQSNIDLDSKNTKRALLSDVSKLFDPLGWLSPLSTKLKIMFQSLWTCNLKWDDPLPPQIMKEWVSIKQEMHQINQFCLPRWLRTEPSKEIQLHGFCDSSLKAYGCVIYCKVPQEDGKSTITLVVGKARLVPLNKSVTLPRLELCGALLLSRVMTKVKESMRGLNIKIYGWTDSTAVLGWIQGNPNRWKTFVANRVTQITTAMPKECWRYVKSQSNPADSLSRGLSVSQLKQHSLWWNGPSFLSSKEYEQENQLIAVYDTEEETRRTKNININYVQQSDSNIINTLLRNHSSFMKVVHVLAWVRRCITKKQMRRQESYITLQEIKSAKTLIIKQVQSEQFAEEINSLLSKKSVHPKSKIANLYPILDVHGVLRVGGRLQHANISPEMKNPIILPTKNRLTELIIAYAHKLTFHGGARVTSSFIRQQYWVISGNRAIKKQIRSCVQCRKQKPEMQAQVMGDLPAARVNPSRPFHHTGVDFTGHVTVKASQGRGIKTTKGYVAIFVCMVTKAVHLELVSDLTTSAFLAALRRMAARKGTPKHLYSDNGRNFVGASRVLQQEYEQISEVFNQEFMSEVTEMEIHWHHNAPSWPTAGGLWEAAVKSFKFHLKRVLGEQNLTYEEFSTLLAQIEACLNSRPLCPISEDPDDLNYLTPSHFLTGGPTMTLIETEKDMRTRWHLTQKILHDLWKRWRSEYLSQLNVRSKWQQPKRSITLDDIVLIHEDNLPPGKWAMGRVVELHPGQDGYTRVVTIKTKNGFMKRPVLKLSILPVRENERDSDQQGSSNQDTTLPHTQANHVQSRRSTSSITTSLIAVMLFLLTCISNAHGALNITKFTNSQSLYFDKIADMQLVTDEWKLVIYYDLDPFWQGTFALKAYVESLEQTCKALDQNTHCELILLQLQHGLSELDYYNHLLLNQHASTSILPTTPTRTKRGLINGIGMLAGELFGVLDVRFAEQYRNDIMLLQTNQQHLASLYKNQTTIVEAEFNLLKRTESSMLKQYKIVNHHLQAIEKVINAIKSEARANFNFSEFNLGAIVTTNLYSSLKSIQSFLLDMVTDIYHGRVSLHLISPEQLKLELSKVANKLPKDMVIPVDSSQEDILKLYKLLEVKTRFMEEYLLFEIRLPLTNRDTFEFMKVVSIPQVRNQNMVTVVPVSTLISLNMKKDTYITMTENDMKSCTLMSNTYVCRIQKPIHHMRGDQSLCETETAICKTIINKCKDTWQESHNINTYIYFCCDKCNLRTICEYQMSAQQLTGAGLVTIEHGCIIKTDNFTIQSARVHSSEIRITPDLYVPSAIAPINRVISMPIPWEIGENKSLEESESPELAQIGKMIKDLKKAPALIDQISSHDIHHYTMIYVTLGIVLLICAASFVRRLMSSWKPQLIPRTQQASADAAAAAAATVAASRASAASPPPAPRRSGAAQGSTSVVNISENTRKDISLSPHYRRAYFKTKEESE